MKAHHTQTHAPLRGRASSLLRAGAPGGRSRIGSSPPGHGMGEGVRPLFGLSGVSLFFFFWSSFEVVGGREGCSTGGLLLLRENVLGTKMCHLANMCSCT